MYQINPAMVSISNTIIMQKARNHLLQLAFNSAKISLAKLELLFSIIIPAYLFLHYKIFY